MASDLVEILNPDGEVTPSAQWFPDPSTSLTSDPFFVVAVIGPQSSGKSTLANAIFSANFPVGSRGTLGHATTRGILAARPTATSPATLVLDVEGADARARGRDAKIFAAMCAAFVAALADVIVVNLWYHDACRLDSAAYSLLHTILKSAAHALLDGVQSKTALVIAVRDTEEDSPDDLDSLRSIIIDDVSNNFLPYRNHTYLSPVRY